MCFDLIVSLGFWFFFFLDLGEIYDVNHWMFLFSDVYSRAKVKILPWICNFHRDYSAEILLFSFLGLGYRLEFLGFFVCAKKNIALWMLIKSRCWVCDHQSLYCLWKIYFGGWNCIFVWFYNATVFFFFSAFYISALCMIVVYWRSKFILYNGLLSFGHAIFWSDTCNDFCGSPEAEAFQSQIKFCVILWFTHVWLGIYNLLDQSILGETVGIIWCSWNVFFNASQPFFLYVWM